MRFCFQIEATEEQVEYTKEIVKYSLENHYVPNIWDSDEMKKSQTEFYRFVGSLGEVAFADAYQLKRHKKSFGASDGQDNGNDFVVVTENNTYIVDLKSMHRKNDIFYGNYVVNIPRKQLEKKESVTDLYYVLSIHKSRNKYYISFLGFIKKLDIIEGKVGILYKNGTVRVRGDNTVFKFLNDTYEVDFKDFIKPNVTEYIKNMNGFKLISIK